MKLTRKDMEQMLSPQDLAEVREECAAMIDPRYPNRAAIKARVQAEVAALEASFSQAQEGS
jgi:hypothetical protein